MTFKTKFALTENCEVPVVADETIEDRFVKLVGEMSGRQVVILVEAPCIEVHDANATHEMFAATWLDHDVANQAALKEIRVSPNTLKAFETRLRPIAEGQRSSTVSF